MRVPTKHRKKTVVATAVAALALATAGPASAGLGDPGPGGPTRFDVGFRTGCDYTTGQFVVTVTLSQDPAYSGWQYAGVYYEVKPVTQSVNYYDVSHDTKAGAGILGPGASPLTYTFRIAPPASGYYLEVDNIDISPADGWYTDANMVTPASCSLVIVPIHFNPVLIP